MHVLLIQTGGTIDKDYPRLFRGGGFEIAEPAAQRILERIDPSFKFKILQLLKKDSLDLDNDDRQKIWTACKDAECTKIIITHGTDTMIETARTLASLKGKTIVITGAMRPERFANSDAGFNLGLAVGALNVLDDGVYIAMHGRVFRHDRVRRDAKSGQFVGAGAEEA